MANVVGYVDKLQRIQQSVRLRATAVQIDRQDGAARLHLPHRKLVLRMAGEVGIEQPRHPRFEETGYLQRIRSEEHTSELQSLMRISYAVFCLKKKTKHNNRKCHTHKEDKKNNR